MPIDVIECASRFSGEWQARLEGRSDALRLDRGQGRSAARDHAMRASFSAPQEHPPNRFYGL